MRFQPFATKLRDTVVDVIPRSGDHHGCPKFTECSCRRYADARRRTAAGHDRHPAGKVKPFGDFHGLSVRSAA